MLIPKQACLDEQVTENQLVLHSDNGKPMKGAVMMSMLEILGVVPSFSRPSVSDDNPYSESLFRTVKYNPSFPFTGKFPDIIDARSWMEKFTNWYNTKFHYGDIKVELEEVESLPETVRGKGGFGSTDK